MGEPSVLRQREAIRHAGDVVGDRARFAVLVEARPHLLRQLRRLARGSTCHSSSRTRSACVGRREHLRVVVEIAVEELLELVQAALDARASSRSQRARRGAHARRRRASSAASSRAAVASTRSVTSRLISATIVCARSTGSGASPIRARVSSWTLAPERDLVELLAAIEQPGAQAVVEVVIRVGDLVGVVGDLRLERRLAAAIGQRHRMLASATPCLRMPSRVS